MTFTSRSNYSLFITFFIFFSLYLALALPKIGQPITDDEVYEIRNAEKILEGKQIQLFVPPIYDIVLAASIAGCGSHPWAFRLPGVICAGITLAVVMAMGGLVFTGKRAVLAAMVAALILAVNPAFIQGSLLVHIDNTLLVPLILLWFYFLLRYCLLRSLKSLLFSGIFLAITLLVKFSTPIILIPATVIFVYGFQKKALSRYLSVITASFLFFFMAWLILSYVMKLPFWQLFNFAAGRLGVYLAASGWKTWCKNLTVLAVWFSPYLLMGVFLSIRKGFVLLAGKRNAINLIFLSMLAVSVYLVISVFCFGFPKYFMPGLTFFILVLVSCVFENDEGPLPSLVSVLCFASVMTVYFLIFLKDPVYLFRYNTREAIITGSGWNELIRNIIFQGIVYLIPFAFYVFYGKIWKKFNSIKLGGLRAFVLILLFSQSFSVSLKQACGDYQTNYSYGERGTYELYDYLKSRVNPGDRVLASQEVLYSLGRRDSSFSSYLWKEKEMFLKLLKDERTRFLVVSIPSHSIVFYREVLLNDEVHAFLKKHFQKKKIGTYEIYERKSVYRLSLSGAREA